MASREKKTASKKTSSSPVPPKDLTETPNEEPTSPEQHSLQDVPSSTKTAANPIKPQRLRNPSAVAKSLKKPDPRKPTVIKRTLKLRGKAKLKTTARKVGIRKSTIEANKILLKNGLGKVVRKRVTVAAVAKINKAAQQQQKGEVLDAIFPFEDNVTLKKPPARTRRPKKLDIEEIDTITQCINSILAETNKPVKKNPVRAKKLIKTEPTETLDDVMNDLTSLIRSEDIKKEETSESESVKAATKKLPIRKTKLELLKKKIKQENKLESSTTVIDMLDLNVKIPQPKKLVGKKRRHSIEKFSLSASSTAEVQNVTMFATRSASPRPPRRFSKLRQSIDNQLLNNRRSSPYTTRSDSPARILRNGKHRKLKHLLDGLDVEYKKRRRLCSDFSGSEISGSKHSGYESDSSYSDLASPHGENDSVVDARNNDSSSAAAIIKKELLESYVNNPPDNPSSKGLVVKQRSLSLDQQPVSNLADCIDTNFNVCVKSCQEENIPVSSSSFKVPEKSIILDSMKISFNCDVAATVVVEDYPQEEKDKEKEKRKTRSTVKKSSSSSLQLKDGISTEMFYNSKATTTPEVESGKVVTEVEEEETKIVEETTVEAVEVTKLVEPVDEIDKPQPETTAETKLVEDYQIFDVVNSEKQQLEAQAALEESIVDQAMEVVTNMEMDQFERSSVTTNSTEDDKSTETILETPENMAIKENILSALGLQSLKAAEEAKLKKSEVDNKQSTYTGTLKTVIKINRERTTKKISRNPLKMTLQKSKPKTAADSVVSKVDEDEYKIMKEGPSSSWKNPGGHSSDTAGALRKTHYSNRSNMDGSSEHTSDGDTNAAEDGAGKLLVIPEKASSFSIHPGRLCKDECSYCFGTFGLFDTPCHIGSMKSVERQEKILATEKHLTRDSCLCDACYRHVDRKTNAPAYMNNKSYKRNIVAPGPRQNHCHVLGCGKESTNILKRKWIIKMRKAVCQVINIDLDNPGLHSIPICEEHYTALEHLMVCAMCKRRLARNHIHYLGPESTDLNAALNEMGIPVKLHDKPVVCKLCKYFATLILKSIEDKTESTLTFENEYRKRLLHFHDIQIMNEEDAEGPIPVPSKDKLEQPTKKKRKLQKPNLTEQQQQSQQPPHLEPQLPNNYPPSRPDSPSDYMVDYNTLIPSINIETGSDLEQSHNNVLPKKSNSNSNSRELFARKLAASSVISTKPSSTITSQQQQQLAGKSSGRGETTAVKRLNWNSSISVRQLFPGEEDLPLNGHVEFGQVKEKTTPEGWEKCVSTVQYDAETKVLWQDLQKPYGNQSSFLRHLILLEKYFRNGDLILSANASHHSSNYTESVHNRLRAYDNIPSANPSIHQQLLSNLSLLNHNNHTNHSHQQQPQPQQQQQPTHHQLQQQTHQHQPPVSILPFNNKLPPNKILREPPLLLNAANIPKNTPISIAQINNAQMFAASTPNLNLNLNLNLNNTSLSKSVTPGLNNSANSNSLNTSTNINGTASTSSQLFPKQNYPSKVPPPGLISLQPGTKKPITPLKPAPPSQKIKFPITKNWRPNLIPIDPTKKIEKKAGLVQVISGGKPYHITFEDYKKMCAIKRTFDLRQKRLQEQKAMMMQQNPTTQQKTVSLKQPAINVTRKGVPISNKTTPIPKGGTHHDESGESNLETSLDKLDKTVESLEMRLNSTEKNSLPLPKIPKSLTVIPQTVVRKLDSSAMLLSQKTPSITTMPSTSMTSTSMAATSMTSSSMASTGMTSTSMTSSSNRTTGKS